VISRVAGGSVLACCCCCLFFLPKRKDIARVVPRRGRWGGSCGLSSTHSACDTDGCARRAAGCYAGESVDVIGSWRPAAAGEGRMFRRKDG
jgi:hypothetical protein